MMVRFLIVVGMAGCLQGCNSQTTSTAPGAVPEPLPPVSYSSEDLRELTSAEKSVLAISIAKGLKDPDSAKFTWLKFPKSPKDAVTWCGMVNAKNSYGGYTGAKPFMALVLVKNGKPVGGVLALAGSDEFSIKHIRAECQKNGWDPFLAV